MQYYTNLSVKHDKLNVHYGANEKCEKQNAFGNLWLQISFSQIIKILFAEMKMYKNVMLVFYKN